jgi:hypothetical protein
MADIRTQAQLQQFMEDEFAWRKKELLGLKSLIIEKIAKRGNQLYVRAAVTLLYAHWEGFFKKIATAYLEYVSRQRLPHKALKENFTALAISKIAIGFQAKNRMTTCVQVVDFLKNQSETTCEISWKTAINTRSNLNSEVLREIILTLGLDYTRFETKENLIDEVLLKHRNNIAHGQQLGMELDEYFKLQDEIYGLMQDFYNQVENAVVSSSFRNAAAS